MRRTLLAVFLAAAMVAIGPGLTATEAGPPFHCNQVNMHPGSLPGGQVLIPYSATFTLTPANNALPITVWSVVPGTLPPGLSLSGGPNSNQVSLTGTPTVAGTYTFTVEIGATYVLGTICRVSGTYTVTIAP